MNKEIEINISAGKTNSQYWKDIWSFRDLFYFLTLRDFQIRYKQTIIGVFWSILRPLVTMVVFTIVFHKVGNFSSDEMPYHVMVLSGLLIWQLFSTVVNDASNSMVSNTALITKVYFPRIIIPISSSLVNSVDFLIGMMIFFIILLFSNTKLSVYLLFIPVPVIACLLMSSGLGLILSSVNVMYRDVKYVVTFLLQLGLYVSPVVFQSSSVPESVRFFLYLNPLSGLIDFVRWCITGGNSNFEVSSFLYSIIFSIFIFSLGVFYFRATERKFADVI